MKYLTGKFEEFKEKIYRKYPNENLEIVLFEGMTKNCIIKCKKCGEIYQMKSARSFLEKEKKKVCRKCIPRDDTIEIGHKVMYLFEHTNKISLINKYTKIGDDLEIKCHHCGQIFKRKPRIFLKSQACPFCETFSKFKTKEVFEQQLIEKLGGEYTLLGDYTGTNETTLFRHNDCGFIFKSKPHTILGKTPCPKCKKFNSKGEIKIRKILDEHQINYQQQKRFKNLSSLLSFDFYIQEYRLLIEFQGEQHFHAIPHFGGETKFLKQQENDKRKRQYCKDNKYSLLEISYKEMDNIENILSFLWLND